MPIPDFQTVMRPVLEVVSDGVPHALSQVREDVANSFGLTEDERRERITSGTQTTINSHWATQSRVEENGSAHRPL